MNGPYPLPLTNRFSIRDFCAGCLLLVLLLPAAVHAQFNYTTNNGTITITGYTGSGGAVTIPSTTNSLPVVSIGNGAFFSKTSLTSITIPNSVTNIGDNAFYFCGSLTNVTIGNGVINIGNYAFQFCEGLTAITIPNSVAQIGNNAFSNCGLTNVTIGTSVVDIGSYAFSYCSLTSVMIPDSVINIGNYAFTSCRFLNVINIGNSVTNIASGTFSGCDSLTSIVVDAGNPVYSSLDGALFDKSQTTLIDCPLGKSGDYTIPNSVTNIGNDAFDYCTRLTNVTIPNSVMSIGYEAFNNCSKLINVAIPNSVTSIGGVAFAYCAKLTNITIPNSVTTVGDGAFSECIKLATVTIGSSVTNIGNLPFSSCDSLAAITVDILNPVYSSVNGVLFDKSQATLIRCPETKAGTYTIPSSVTSIEKWAFYECISLTSVTLGNNGTRIGDDAFVNCTILTNITLGNSVTNIGYRAFFGCISLKAIAVNDLNPIYSSVNGVLFNKSQTTLIQYPAAKTGPYAIPNSVISIDDSAFSYCGLTNVTIPDSVTSIGTNAFYNCTKLTNVVIPSSVTSIKNFAFYYCTQLAALYFQGNAPADYGVNIFSGDTNVIYYLPGTTGWGATFVGRPTRLWNPQAQTSDGSFGVRTNRFGFNITGTSNLVIVVDACTNLALPVWFPVKTNTLSSTSVYFSDPQWTNNRSRFYRLRSP